MKLKSICYLLCCMPFIVNANPISTSEHNLVSFEVEVAKNVSRDLMRVTMYTQEEGSDIKLVNKAVSERLNWAIEEVKKQSAVEIRDQNRATQVRYNSVGKQSGWIDRGDIVLQSTDSSALSQVVSLLNEKLVIDQISSAVSNDKLKSLEEEMTKAIFAKFEQKAGLIQQMMKAKGYRVIELQVGDPDEIGDFHSPRMYAAKMNEAQSMPLESGSSTIKARMHAKIELTNE